MLLASIGQVANQAVLPLTPTSERPSTPIRKLYLFDYIVIARYSDLLVLACGSNDVSHNEASSVINAIKSTLKKNVNKRIILVHLPNRFDLSDWSCVNVEIRKTNEKLKRLSEQLGNVSLVQASKADSSLYTRHGMHLSLRGKQWLTSKILEAAVVMTTEQPPPPGCQEEQSTSTRFSTSISIY
ncbi:hypothetical protein J6590_048176 [Homalodisca vitripennis]|nr:hypothetical protein J6590_048176 [Homalodisca vitripennis]